MGIFQSQYISCKFNDSHLHTQANTKERQLFSLAYFTAMIFPSTPADQNRVHQQSIEASQFFSYIFIGNIFTVHIYYLHLAFVHCTGMNK